VLWGKEFLGLPYLFIGVESVLKADFGPKGWDWAGLRLDICGELGQQVQRSASATPCRASSMCSPQPDQVAFLQISQMTFEHIGWLLALPVKNRTLDFINTTWSLSHSESRFEKQKNPRQCLRKVFGKLKIKYNAFHGKNWRNYLWEI